jgi:PAS domain S-box-containing protein
MMMTWGPLYTQIFNDAFLPIVGGGPRLDAALGADARRFWGPTWEAAMPSIEAVLRGGAPVLTEDHLIPLERDGRVADAYVTYSISPALDDDASVAGLLILVQETTERVLATAAAAARERMFRIVAEMAHVGGWVVDLETGICHWSEQVCELHGAPVGTTLTPEDGVRWFAPEFRETVGECFTRVVSAGTPYELDVQIVTASGQRRWVRTSGELVRDAEGRPRLVRGTLRDIEEQRAADLKVQEQAALLDLASDAIILHDLEGTVLYWNDGASRMFGHAAVEVLGRKASDLRYEDAAVVGGAVQRAFADGHWAGELRMHRRDGSPIVFDSRWTVVRDAAGVPQRILAIGTDVTERHKLLQQFLRAQRMESIGALAGGIAHDLNNVLAPILMSVELLREEVRAAEGHELLDALQTSAERGAGMVRQILTFARGVEGDRLAVDTRHIVRDVERVVRDTFPKNITIANRLPNDLHVVVGNPTQFHQVLMNLVVNARDAMPDGGTIVIRGENIDVDEQYAAMSQDAKPGRYVCVSVIDDGEGMSPQVLSRIYEPFFTTKPVGSGTGLGIPTTLGIVRAHGGFMTIYSDLGKGSVFRLYFPAADDASVAQAVATAVEVPRGSGDIVLVVEDDCSVRTILAATLEAYGYRVLLAENGAQAVDRFRDQRASIALVITDLTMPVLDGPRALRAIREMDPQVPCIVMSGLPDVGALHIPKDIAISATLAKPFTAAALLQSVHRFKRPVVT